MVMVILILRAGAIGWFSESLASNSEERLKCFSKETTIQAGPTLVNINSKQYLY